MSDPASALAPTIHDQPATDGKVLRSFGHVEVLSIKRRSRKHPELLLFKGSPGSKHSIVKSALITIAETPDQTPAPWLDKENGRLHLCYPSQEHPELAALLKDPGAYLCYFWISSDGAQSHAWLLKIR